ncbi:MAG TPA: protein kinase family protein [Jiangellales bacterium]|nr:protein kinase family protein [Jiangellales bacterium]
MTSQAVGPGWRLAGRYRLDDLLGESSGVRAWKAVDEVLRRPVFVQTLSDDDPRSAALARSARAASVVTDTRFLRVLDVAQEGGTTYVVREWVPGHDLGTLLASGPLPPDRAATLVREVADALAAAHRQGLSHRCLQPDSVLVTPEGAVKVAGLGTAAVLAGVGDEPGAGSTGAGSTGPGSTGAGSTGTAATGTAATGTAATGTAATAGDPGRADAVGLGRLLYAALTGRWPAGPGGPVGLPPAPVVDGRVASPRQGRPGIPRGLDEAVDRALGTPGRQHGPTLGGPAEVVVALTSAGAAARQGALQAIADDAVPLRSGQPSPHPALIPDEGRPRARAAVIEPLPVARSAPGDRRVIRVLAVVAGLLFLAGATLLGLQLLVGDLTGGEDTDPDPGTAGPVEESTDGAVAPPTGDPVPLPVNVVTDYDPPPGGNGEENPDSVGFAVDGDPETVWFTQTYFDPMELQKPGVGLVLDLGEPRTLRAVQLLLAGETSGVEIRVAPEEATVAPEQPDGWTVVAAAEEAGTSVDLTLEQAVTTGWVLVWFTRLPPVDGDFRGGVAEVVALG